MNNETRNRIRAELFAGKHLFSEGGTGLSEHVHPLVNGGWNYTRYKIYDEYDHDTEHDQDFTHNDVEQLLDIIMFPEDMAENI